MGHGFYLGNRCFVREVRLIVLSSTVMFFHKSIYTYIHDTYTSSSGPNCHAHHSGRLTFKRAMFKTKQNNQKVPETFFSGKQQPSNHQSVHIINLIEQLDELDKPMHRFRLIRERGEHLTHYHLLRYARRVLKTHTCRCEMCFNRRRNIMRMLFAISLNRRPISQSLPLLYPEFSTQDFVACADDGGSASTPGDNIASLAPAILDGAAGDLRTTNPEGMIKDINSGVTTSQTTAFHSEVQGELAQHSAPAPLPDDVENRQVGTELADFLKRPVLVNSFQYGVSTPVGVNFYPWREFLLNPIIKKKLDNYAYIRCTLKIKIILNVSPFFYGAVLYSYQPYSSGKDLPISSNYVTPRSQRRCVWVYPQDNAGGEMELPFFYPLQVLPLVQSRYTEMGQINVTTLFPLASANGTAPPNITIQTYAWAENVELYGSSIYTTAGSASVAKMLDQVPFIGRAARVSVDIAKKFGSIAGALGYSAKPLETIVNPMLTRSLASLATTDVDRAVEKFTLDPKAETNIDPSTMGLPSIDEMDINYLVRKESFLAYTAYPLGLPTGSDILGLAANPGMVVPLVSNMIIESPMSYISHMFQYWRGDIVVRFKFIKTRFHKGRLRITFDPHAQDAANSTDYQVRKTHIIDLGETDEVEFTMPYMNPAAWCNTVQATTTPLDFWSVGGSTLAETYNLFSGYLRMSVETPLTAPDAGAVMPILVFVRGGSNMEFAAPSNTNSAAWLQSPVAPPTEGDSNIDEFISPIDTGNFEPTSLQLSGGDNMIKSTETVHTTYVGEKVYSLRTLAQRMAFFRNESLKLSQPSTDSGYLYTIRLPHNGFPWARGVYNPANLPVTSKQMLRDVGGPKVFEDVVTPLCVRIAAMFCAHRGSIQWASRFISGSSVTNDFQVAWADRTDDWTYRLVGAVPIIAAVATSDNALDLAANNLLQNSTQGTVVSQRSNDPFLKFVSPNYNRYKFYLSDTAYRDGQSKDDSNKRGVQPWLYYTPNPRTTGTMHISVVMQEYVSAGHDWECFYFLNVPVYWITSVPNPPVPA